MIPFYSWAVHHCDWSVSTPVLHLLSFFYTDCFLRMLAHWASSFTLALFYPLYFFSLCCPSLFPIFPLFCPFSRSDWLLWISLCKYILLCAHTADNTSLLCELISMNPCTHDDMRQFDSRLESNREHSDYMLCIITTQAPGYGLLSRWHFGVQSYLLLYEGKMGSIDQSIQWDLD